MLVKSQSLFLLDIYSFKTQEELIKDLETEVSILIFTGYLFFQKKNKKGGEKMEKKTCLNPYFYWISILSQKVKQKS
ncbi:MAG: hypothetical protein JG768_1414 [Fusobacteriales bacterium]|nr:hypothetical protein [Fusobacteriales bacterium]